MTLNCDRTNEEEQMQTAARPLPITIGSNPSHVTVEVSDGHGDDWFALSIGTLARVNTTLYLRRAELKALRDRLDEIDQSHPEVVE